MKIDSCEFGEVVVDGKRYTDDVIIYPEKVVSDWERKNGHEIGLEDIKDVIEYNPEIIVVGTGMSGMLKILPETRELFMKKNIELIEMHTKEASERFNKIIDEKKKAVACLHLTC